MKVRDLPRVAVAIGRVMADSTRTGEIHAVEELTGVERLGAFLVEHGGDPEVRRLLRERPELCSEQVDYDALRAMPADSLGATYVRHLDDNELSADYQAAATQYIDGTTDLGYIIRRYRQTHDVWHALLGLGIAGHEEVLVHAFSWGQLRLPVSGLVVAFGTLKHFVLESRWSALRRDVLTMVRAGRSAEPLLGVRWEGLWSVPIAEVRRRYRIEPLRG